MLMIKCWQSFLIVFAVGSHSLQTVVHGETLDQRVETLLQEFCVDCHNPEEANGEVNFQAFESVDAWIRNPNLILKTMNAIATSAMPPESEAAPPDEMRQDAIAALKFLLRRSGSLPTTQPLRRLNRFQYNNTVRDLFQLNRDVFPLPEKLMTRYDEYLNSSPEGVARMPEVVHVASHALNPLPGLDGVKPFPKDLRANHGFDNQADQLTLSPLLLDAFLQLSVSILESPDFNQDTVGIWNEFFLPPDEGENVEAAVRQRLSKFLRVAFRGILAEETLNRYVGFVNAKLMAGSEYTAAMKKVVSVAMSSPMFLYRASPADRDGHQFEIASRLSYFLWASCPDDALLTLAEEGKLGDGNVLRQTVARMLSDQKIERFLDTFPTQWMQLENLLAATPDPAISRYFRLDTDTPASLQMVLEPLLLFDSVFLEDRPITDLVSPSVGYRSEFLQTWYDSDLQPTPVDREAILAANRRLEARRNEVKKLIESYEQSLSDLLDPVRRRLLELKKENGTNDSPIDLRPYAAWEFDGDLNDSMQKLPLTANGEVSFDRGMVVLQKAFLQSKPLPMELRAKSLEVQFRLSNLDQRGGGLMGIQGPGDFFDTIVIGERKNRHWISGSNGFSRTEDFPESFEEATTDELVHLLMVYGEDETTTLYRNGRLYGKPFKKPLATFPKDRSSVLFGLRHLPAGGNRFLNVSIDHARFYDRALTVDEVEAAAASSLNFISNAELVASLTEQQRQRRAELVELLESARKDLKAVPANTDVDQAVEQARQQFENDLRRQMRSREFRAIQIDDQRYGGIITNAAMLSMTSGQRRTHPVARGVWVIEVILNDPPNPPPNDVPALDEDNADKSLTIREQFAMHRENDSCAGCHNRLDPLGFALENYDITGRWRDKYPNGRQVDVTGTFRRRHNFADVVEFKAALLREDQLFVKAFTKHLLRFAVARELSPRESLTVEDILQRMKGDPITVRGLIREVVLSSSFQQ